MRELILLRHAHAEPATAGQSDLDPQRRHVGQGRPLPHFDGLVHCIEELFVTGRPVYPVERTLLTTGTLSFALESRYQKKRLETPQLNVTYRQPKDCFFQRA